MSGVLSLPAPAASKPAVARPSGRLGRPDACSPNETPRCAQPLSPERCTLIRGMPPIPACERPEPWQFGWCVAWPAVKLRHKNRARSRWTVEPPPSYFGRLGPAAVMHAAQTYADALIQHRRCLAETAAGIISRRSGRGGSDEMTTVSFASSQRRAYPPIRRPLLPLMLAAVLMGA
jgi:hypothetical protein